MKTSITSTIKKTLIILFWLIIWQLLATFINKPLIFASFTDCLYRFSQLLIDKTFYLSLFITLSETLLGLFIAFVLAILLSYFCYKHILFQEIIDPLIAVLKSVPVVSIAIILLIWQGNKFLSFFVSFSVVFPNVYYSLLVSFNNTDKHLLDACNIYKLSNKEIFIHIHLFNIRNVLIAITQSSISMAFKSTIASEVISLTTNSMGLQLYYCKLNLDTSGLFCYTFTLILLSYLSEKIIMKILERRS